MAVPKKRHSNSRQNKRRFSNYRLKSKSSTTCPSCGAPVLPHRACPSCGTYKGRIVKPKKDKTKKARGKEKK